MQIAFITHPIEYHCALCLIMATSDLIRLRRQINKDCQKLKGSTSKASLTNLLQIATSKVDLHIKKAAAASRHSASKAIMIS